MRLKLHPNKILRKQCRPITELTKRRKDKIQKMLELMRKFKGIGIAAPQLGWNAQVFVMNVTQDPKDDLVFINPEIVEVSGDIVEYPEGCLSLPGIIGIVDRPQKLVMRATNLEGEEFTFTDDALAARCAMHEFDHLLGILIIDLAKEFYKGNNGPL